MTGQQEGSNPQQTTETAAADQTAATDEKIATVQSGAATRVSHYMTDRSTHYHEVNAGANRSQATRLKAPALTWHRAFWLQPRYTGLGIQDEARLQRDRNRKKAIIDGIILSVWSFIYKKSCVKNSGFRYIEFYPKVRRDKARVYLLFGHAVKTQLCGNRKELGFIGLGVDGLQRREREIFTSDSRVVGLRFYLHGMEITLRIELYSEYFTLTLYAEFPGPEDKKRLNELPKELRDKHGQIGTYFGAPTEREGRSLNELFFHTFWRRNFLKEFLTDTNLGKELDGDLFREVFADFRGVIVCEKNFKVKVSKLNKDKELDWANHIHEPCSNLFSHHKRYECTASYMLDGRAAYLTTLAPQFPEVADNELIPLEYVLFVHHEYDDGEVNGRVNRWQLGRLVDRIHLLDTVRLASLLYLPALRHAGQTLSHLDSYINAAREAIDPSREESKGDAAQQVSGGSVPQIGGATKSEKETKDAFKHMETAHRLFAKITRDFNDGTKTNTGILYRIEQSRYYKEQFSKNLPGLRLCRIEGFQKYDEFIERRQGPAIDFIDRLGRRYERATVTITALDQNYLAMETNHIDGIIRKIQQWGEFFLLAALVPYYLVHLTAQIVQEKYMPLFAVGVWTVLISIALYQISDGSRSQTRRRLATAPFLLVAIAVLVLTFTGQSVWGGLFRFWGSRDELLTVAKDLPTSKEMKAQIEQLHTDQRDLLSVEKGLLTSEEMTAQIKQLGANQGNLLEVEKELLKVQQHSEEMQMDAIRMMQILSELKDFLDAQKNAHRK